MMVRAVKIAYLHTFEPRLTYVKLVLAEVQGYGGITYVRTSLQRKPSLFADDLEFVNTLAMSSVHALFMVRHEADSSKNLG